jgi:hypothetical protein
VVIDILEALVIHKAMVLGRMRCAAISGNGLSDQAVHFFRPRAQAGAAASLVGVYKALGGGLEVRHSSRCSACLHSNWPTRNIVLQLTP